MPASRQRQRHLVLRPSVKGKGKKVELSAPNSELFLRVAGCPFVAGRTVACVPLPPLFAMSPTADKARGAIIIHTELYK